MKSSITRQFRWGFTILILLLLMAVNLPVLAEGDGSGGGQNVPLGLASSEPANGAQNVPSDTKIKLTFNKNVINMTVKENNLRCFSLYAGSIPVPLEIQMADDQIYPELKRQVILVPRQGLEEGKDYTVVISGTLQAKSGAVLGQDVKIKFRTAAVNKTVPETAPPAPAVEENTPEEAPATVEPENVSQPETTATAESAGKVSAPEQVETEVRPEPSPPSPTESINKKPPAPADDSERYNAWIWPALIVVIVLALGYGYLKKRR